MAIILTVSNHANVAKEIVKRLNNRTFNILIQRAENNIVEEKMLKLCGRKVVADKVKTNEVQTVIPLLPGGSIAWDIKVERVGVSFGENGDICIYRHFIKTARVKFLRITADPI